MLFGLKSLINDETKATTAMETAAENMIENDIEDIKDAFLDDPEGIVLGAENDPEIGKLIDSLPDDIVDEVEDVTAKDIEKITEECIPEAITSDGDDLSDNLTDPMEGQPIEDTEVKSTPLDESVEDELGISPDDEDLDDEDLDDTDLFDTVNEGEQADAYKERKAKEEADRKADETEKDNRRGIATSVGNRLYQNPNASMTKIGYDNYTNKSKAELDRGIKANNKTFGHAINTHNYNTKDIGRAADATNRHMRRHPETESFDLDDTDLFDVDKY